MIEKTIILSFFLILLCAILFKLLLFFIKKLSLNNKHQLGYLIIFFITILIRISLNFIALVLNKKVIQFLLLALISLGAFSLYMHIKALYNKSAVRINLKHLSPMLISYIFIFLFEIDMISFEIPKSRNIDVSLVGVQLNNFEKILPAYSITLFFNLIYYISAISIIKKYLKEKDIIQKKLVMYFIFIKRFVLYNMYSLIFLLMVGLLGLLRVDFLYLIIIFYLLTIGIIIYFFLYPNMINGVVGFNIFMEKNKVLNDQFEHIKNSMISKKLYLNSDFSLSLLSIESGISTQVIRESLRVNKFKNLNTFCNEIRVEYSVNKINEGFLLNHSIETLLNESGFKSQQTFYRAFKRKYLLTPNEYWKNLSS